jgi:hypothetical protein
MKTFLLCISIFFVAGCTGTSTLPDNPPGSYPAGVSFNSICCGPPSEEFLKTFLQKFNKENNLSVIADKIAGCGREGEFVILFSIGKLKPAIQQKFVTSLETLVVQQDQANKKENTSSGGIELLRNISASAYDHCRIKSQRRLY